MNGIEKICQIESKYMKNYESRKIQINSQKQQLILFHGNDPSKKFKLDSIKFLTKQDSYQLQTDNRRYKIHRDQNSQQINNYLIKWNQYKNFPNIKQQKIIIPKSINYFAPLRPNSFNQDWVIQQKALSKKLESIKEQKKYLRNNSYIINNDWARDQIDGGLLFINQDKKSNQGKIIRYVCKKVLTTGSFMGISFPVFAMKPQSMLQTICKAMGILPLIFPGSQDPIQRIKYFNCFLLSFSLLFTDMDKPFNPTIGQTFQASLGPTQVCCQQISHHPPISAVLLNGLGYSVHGAIQLDASLSINSATGIFYGDFTIEFDDGGVVKGKIPSGILSGLIFGKDRFVPCGAVYSHDPINQIVSSFQVVEGDTMRGYIGKLKKKSYDKFLAQSIKRQRFSSYKHIPEKDWENKYSTIHAIWSKQVSYDGKVYVDYAKEQWLPYLTQNHNLKLLESDSRHRNDIKLRSQGLIQQSQLAKEQLEERERTYRKIREKRNKK